MGIFILSLAALAASAPTLFSGFDLGTLLGRHAVRAVLLILVPVGLITGLL